MEQINEQKQLFYEVDGRQVTLEEFQEMQADPKIQLREVAPGKFKIFERLYS
jgi:hypothetical protein